MYHTRTTIVVALAAAALLLSSALRTPGSTAGIGRHVGPIGDGQALTPVGQQLSPAGLQVMLPGLRPQAIALSPDGKLLIASGKTAQLIVIDPATGTIRQRVPLPPEPSTESPPGVVSTHILQPDTGGQLSFTGLIFSPRNDRIFLSNVNGSIKVFGVNADGTVNPLYSLPLPASGLSTRKDDIPAGLAISADGARLFVALNLSNRVAELDSRTGRVERLFDVGAEPFGLALDGEKLYVTNWAGRRPIAGSAVGPAGQGTVIRVDPVRYIANSGSVSVIDLRAGRVSRELEVGLHPSALALSPDRQYLAVANAGSDSVNVLRTATDRVVETVALRRRPGDRFGLSPDALAFIPDGSRLFVANGTQNALAVVEFRPGHSRVLGLIPTGWFPGGVCYDAARRTLDVANIKGIGSWGPVAAGQRPKFNSHQYYGTVSLIPVPGAPKLQQDTVQVLRNSRSDRAEAALLPPRRHVPARPVPERSGEPSLIHHVVYIIKENRTYDQVLGDMREGDGDPALCTFGEDVTPNEHQLARQFVLLDNTYCCSILSADGHQWTDSAFATDEMERSFAGFPRAYPDGMGDGDVDSLAYSPAGFLWDSAIRHHVSLRDYGEFTTEIAGWKDPARAGEPHFLDYYRDTVSGALDNGTAQTRLASRPSIASLGPYMNRSTIGWDLSVPDQFRANRYIQELRQFEQTGRMPALEMICLPNDHTSGTAPGAPTPAAQVADNDLALGRIVEAISHSRFWRDTAVFVIEDDPQAGWDHVNAFRTTAYVISPYTQRHTEVGELYTQAGMVRTIELILGLPSMNLFDSIATPMSGCFTNRPDLTPYTAIRNRIPLDQMNPMPQAIRDPQQRALALASARLPLGEADDCPEGLLNRILWHAQKGSAPYPQWAAGE